jgi:hypothetical protein
MQQRSRTEPISSRLLKQSDSMIARLQGLIEVA